MLRAECDQLPQVDRANFIADDMACSAKVPPMNASPPPFSGQSVDLPRAERHLWYLRWAMLLLAGALLLLASTQALRLAWLPLLQALLTLGALNLMLPWLKRQQLGPLWLIRIGVCADLLALSEVLAFSGGAANPLASLYLPPVLFAALLSPGLFAWAVALLAVTVYGLLFFWHLPWPLAHADAAYAFYAHQIGMWLIFSLSALLMTGFISYLSRQLSEREAQLALARETQLRDEQLVALGMQAAVAAHALSTPLNTLTLLVDEWRDTQGNAQAQPELELMQGQLGLCRNALTQLKHQTQTGALRLPLYQTLSERLLGWRALRPDVRLDWRVPPGNGPWVRLDASFWPALFNLINNAAEAGGGRVEVSAQWRDGMLQVDIVNRQGCLTPAQLVAAGLTPLSSAKPAGMGLGVMLSHATLARLGGSLTLDNRASGGVHAMLTLPLREEGQE